MFTSVLIANRGEIAVRVARACADLGIKSVAVYAPEDRDALHVRVADQSYVLPGETAADTYLCAEAVVAVALKAQVQAVHPGYGFLAESAHFAQLVLDAGLAWVGPPPAALEQVSNKVAARQLAERAGVPLLPASVDPVENADAVQAFAAQYGYPVVIKAVHGGGGRGMRVVWSATEADAALAACQREAEGAFGHAACFVERFLVRPRHVETQCLADTHGRVEIVSTRDCTIQRRHQKLIEEAPAPFLSPQQEELLTQASQALLQTAGYQGAATCEFLLGQDSEIYFMEINPRLQVEHTVTEEVTGVDLVQYQLQIAAGQPLSDLKTAAVGHAIEFRINAEDPANGFLPTPGTISRLRLPGGPGLRCDFGYEAGDQLTGSFDSMLGKVIVRGQDRTQALARARRALRELKVTGVATVRNLHRAVLEAPAFTAVDQAGFTVHTGWLEQEFAPVVAALPPAGSELGASGEGTVPATSRLVVEVDGKRLEVVLPTELTASSPPAPRRSARRNTGPAVGALADGSVTAPMQGSVVRVAVQEGELVEEGALLLVLEAMKMEQPLTAPRSGRVRSLDATPGQRVATCQVLCVVE